MASSTVPKKKSVTPGANDTASWVNPGTSAPPLLPSDFQSIMNGSADPTKLPAVNGEGYDISPLIQQALNQPQGSQPAPLLAFPQGANDNPGAPPVSSLDNAVPQGQAPLIPVQGATRAQDVMQGQPNDTTMPAYPANPSGYNYTGQSQPYIPDANQPALSSNPGQGALGAIPPGIQGPPAPDINTNTGGPNRSFYQAKFIPPVAPYKAPDPLVPPQVDQQANQNRIGGAEKTALLITAIASALSGGNLPPATTGLLGAALEGAHEGNTRSFNTALQSYQLGQQAQNELVQRQVQARNEEAANVAQQNQQIEENARLGAQASMFGTREERLTTGLNARIDRYKNLSDDEFLKIRMKMPVADQLSDWSDPKTAAYLQSRHLNPGTVLQSEGDVLKAKQIAISQGRLDAVKQRLDNLSHDAYIKTFSSLDIPSQDALMQDPDEVARMKSLGITPRNLVTAQTVTAQKRETDYGDIAAAAKSRAATDAARLVQSEEHFTKTFGLAQQRLQNTVTNSGLSVSNKLASLQNQLADAVANKKVFSNPSQQTLNNEDPNYKYKDKNGVDTQGDPRLKAMRGVFVDKFTQHIQNLQTAIANLKAAQSAKQAAPTAPTGANTAPAPAGKVGIYSYKAHN